MEAFLHSVLPEANRKHIKLGVFADDCFTWKTGSDISKIATDLSKFLSNSIDPWMITHNMILILHKCHSYLFSQWYRDPKPVILLHGTPLSYGSTSEHTYLKILGVCLDGRLSFKYHLPYMSQQVGQHLHQLSRVSNSIYGLDQADLITMYTSYVRSVLEYAAPVWYPCMSVASVNKLQRLQNRGLRIALGVSCSTRIDSLHFEAGLPPLWFAMM